MILPFHLRDVCYAFHILQNNVVIQNDDWFILECYLFGCKLAKLHLEETLQEGKEEMRWEEKKEM